MQSSGKSNILGYTRGNTSYNKEKGKSIELEEKETSKDPMEKVTNMIKELVTSQNQIMANQFVQLNNIQNRIITMERNNGPRNFQPRQNQMYQKKFPQQERRIPNQLDSANMVEEVIPWCRPCEQFHQEITCYVANQVMEHGLLEFSSQETTSREPDHMYMVLKYCNFEEYSICIFCGPRWSYRENHLYYLCTPMLLIRRTNKSQEVVP